MRMLAYNARLLLRNELIAETWFFNAAVRIKLLNGKIVSINHESELYEQFPDFKLFTFDIDFCDRLVQDDIDDYDDLRGMWNAEPVDMDKIREAIAAL